MREVIFKAVFLWRPGIDTCILRIPLDRGQRIEAAAASGEAETRLDHAGSDTSQPTQVANYV
jgi:hypothetical protein